MPGRMRGQRPGGAAERFAKRDEEYKRTGLTEGERRKKELLEHFARQEKKRKAKKMADSLREKMAKRREENEWSIDDESKPQAKDESGIVNSNNPGKFFDTKDTAGRVYKGADIKWDSIAKAGDSVKGGATRRGAMLPDPDMLDLVPSYTCRVHQESNPKEGDTWLDHVSGYIHMYDGGQWVKLGAIPDSEEDVLIAAGPPRLTSEVKESKEKLSRRIRDRQAKSEW